MYEIHHNISNDLNITKDKLNEIISKCCENRKLDKKYLISNLFQKELDERDEKIFLALKDMNTNELTFEIVQKIQENLANQLNVTPPQVTSSIYTLVQNEKLNEIFNLTFWAKLSPENFAFRNLKEKGLLNLQKTIVNLETKVLTIDEVNNIASQMKIDPYLVICGIKYLISNEMLNETLAKDFNSRLEIKKKNDN